MFGWIYYIILLVVCLLSVAANRHLYAKLFVPWFGLLFSVLAIELWKYFDNYGTITSYLRHAYQPVEFFWLCFLYSRIIKNAQYQKYWKYLVLLYFVAASVLSVYVDGVGERNTASFLLESIVVVSLSLFVLYEQYGSRPEDQALYKQPIFWINTAHLFFYSVCFAGKSFENIIYKDFPDIKDMYLLIVRISNYILYGMYLIASVCRRKLL